MYQGKVKLEVVERRRLSAMVADAVWCLIICLPIIIVLAWMVK